MIKSHFCLSARVSLIEQTPHTQQGRPFCLPLFWFWISFLDQVQFRKQDMKIKVCLVSPKVRHHPNCARRVRIRHGEQSTQITINLRGHSNRLRAYLKNHLISFIHLFMDAWSGMQFSLLLKSVFLPFFPLHPWRPTVVFEFIQEKDVQMSSTSLIGIENSLKSIGYN